MKQKTDPCVFIAYSWDSDFHKEKVKKLVHNLRLDGINVVYDGDLQFGERIQHFCETSISKSDIVLFICTPKYKDRADNRISGVGYESGIITSELFETCNENKFIPSTESDTTDCICSVKTNGKWNEFVGICVKKDDKCITFASGGDYITKVDDSSCYSIGDEVFIDCTDNKLKILSGETAITSKIKRTTVGIITAKINETTLAVFKS